LDSDPTMNVSTGQIAFFTSSTLLDITSTLYLTEVC
jgi:hypothetical protein